MIEPIARRTRNLPLADWSVNAKTSAIDPKCLYRSVVIGLGRSVYNRTMKRTLAVASLSVIFAMPAVAQLGPPQKLKPTRFCSSSDNSLECVTQRNQVNIDHYTAEYKEQVRKQAEELRVQQQERERLRMIREKDCNPRVQRCD